jgi:hypothetical protein
VDSLRALGSDHPVLEVPLPSPISGLDLTIEIPLAANETDAPIALCVAPDSQSLIGGWGMDADDADGQQAQSPPADDRDVSLRHLRPERQPVSHPDTSTETARVDEPEARVTRRPATVCLVEIDLGALDLPKRRWLRARGLAILAAEYGPQLRSNPYLQRFEVLIIADIGRRWGLWIWLVQDPNTIA